MHRKTKITVAATAAALLMAAGVSSAMAAPAGKVTICHRTGSDKNPYVMITISQNAVPAHERHPAIHGRTDKIPAPTDASGHPFCPTGEEPPPPPPPPPPGDDNDAGNCIASNSSGDSTQTQSGLVNVGNVNLGLDNLGSNLFCGSSVANNPTVAILGSAFGGFVGSDSGDGGCIADNTSGDSTQDQAGLVNVGNVNVGANNLLANAFCGSSVLNNLTASVLGDAIGGVVDSASASASDDEGDSDDAGCIADNTSLDSVQDQVGGVNVGNLNVGGNNLLANAFCQANVLNNPTVSVLGLAGGSTFGTGLGSDPLGILSDPLGILSGGPSVLGSGSGGLLYGLTANVDVLANVLLHF